MNREKRCQLSLPPPPRDTINLARDTARCSAQPDVKRVRHEKKKKWPNRRKTGWCVAMAGTRRCTSSAIINDGADDVLLIRSKSNKHTYTRRSLRVPSCAISITLGPSTWGCSARPRRQTTPLWRRFVGGMTTTCPFTVWRFVWPGGCRLGRKWKLHVQKMGTPLRSICHRIGHGHNGMVSGGDPLDEVRRWKRLS